MVLKGSQTELNLLKAFAGESQARNKYQMFAMQAKKDGFVSIQRIFNETADHELSHAKTFFKFLDGGNVEINTVFSCTPVLLTLDNLKNAMKGEFDEYSNLYPDFKNTAEAEGFKKIASMFKVIAEVEKQHENRFKQLLNHLNNNTFYKREKALHWKCLKCGYVHFSKNAFDMCPACNHPQSYFEAIEALY